MLRKLLREVVTEAGEDHVVVGLRGSTDTSPGITLEIAVLHSVLEAAVFGVVVKAIDKLAGEFGDCAGCAQAVCRCTRAVRRVTGNADAAKTGGWGCGKGLDAATSVGAGDGRITNHFAGIRTYCAQVGSTLRVFRTVVDVEIEFLLRVKFERTKELVVLDGLERSIGMRSDVRQGRGAVAAYAGAAEEVEAKVRIVRDGRAGVGEEAATDLGVVGSTHGGWDGEGLVGVVTVAEPTNQAAGLKVGSSHIVGTLDDQVGGDVVGVVGSEVIETATRACVTDEEVCVRVGCRVDDLSFFNGDRTREAANLLLEPYARLTLPAETDVVLRVDGSGQVLGAIIGALLGFGDERPHLTAGYSEPAVGSGLREDLALAKNVAVALVLVAAGSCAEEVSFDVTREIERSGVGRKRAPIRL